ncbi:MAG: NAD(P)/FAD-dependent oxidoreductase [Pseudobacter sp.]|uniref:NAD(P)/FAD-dependent oxidoreductase n=1 Tax=Pseudobacter sp. TaxID=2045420 RepID=UPI003F818A48
MPKTAIIIGAGPAGLTAAYELLERTDIIPVVLEKSGDLGGIAKTVNYKGNRIDLGGHRFFSKSDRVMNWWLSFMPLEETADSNITIRYQQQERSLSTGKTASPRDADQVMLVRSRLSRIYFLRKFFSYPIQLSFQTLNNLGLKRTISIMFSYLRARIAPRKEEKSLEDFLVNRFGFQLYELFFRDYTEKVWGVPCSKISAEWGAQRIKKISLSKVLAHALLPGKKNGDIAQKGTETSLIERFLYPKFGPGQLWEAVARDIEERGGKILMHQDVQQLTQTNNRITSVTSTDKRTGKTQTFEGEYFFSTMPVQELIAGLSGEIPGAVREVAAGLQYRDFITVGILLKELNTVDSTGKARALDLKDNWIYIQESDVKVGRLQLFHNWSPYMVKDPSHRWVGMEYFCNETDDFWKMPDDAIRDQAIRELTTIGLARKEDVLDAVVLRMEKTYPAYFGTYNRFDLVRDFTDQIPNLFLIGRNGMHKYNNSDHSMLTAMVAVDNIVDGLTDKSNLWQINTEQEYHEEKAE